MVCKDIGDPIPGLQRFRALRNIDLFIPPFVYPSSKRSHLKIPHEKLLAVKVLDGGV